MIVCVSVINVRATGVGCKIGSRVVAKPLTGAIGSLGPFEPPRTGNGVRILLSFQLLVGVEIARGDRLNAF
eukprot:11193004-Lingulodinium_polyedra.AAC.1